MTTKNASAIIEMSWKTLGSSVNILTTNIIDYTNC